MSSQPPYTPPGGVPPYDPRTQWRAYREQQRAAWRAQRDAWKAQRYAWKAGYGGRPYAPRIPSVVGPIILVAVGVIGLLIYSGRIEAAQFWTWYGRWWPLLLIIAGLALLGEWALDLRRDTPVRRSGGFVGGLIFLAILGLGAAGWTNWWGPMRANFGDNGDNFFNMFGLPEHDQDQQALNANLPANAVIQIENPRGDVSVTAADGNQVQVQAHLVAYASSDDSSRKIFDAEQTHVTVSGNTALVKSDSNSSGRVNMAVTVPKGAQVTINAGRGDVTVAGLGDGVNIVSSHGDVHLSSIQGSVQVRFPGDKHEFSAHDIQGDVTASGNCNDLTLSEIKGKVVMDGEIFGDVHFENLSGPLHLHTSITDVELGSLPGDMTLDSDDLRVTEAHGEVRVTTHAKDVDLGQIYGDVNVNDNHGQISIEPAGSYNLQATNGKGDIEVTLPPDASATVDARTRNGDIVSDYPIPSLSDDESKSARFTVGSGKANIQLTTDVGDIHVKKGSGFAPAAPEAPEAPAPPKTAPHLKAPKTPESPVTQ
jgi:DUF4097 and DUF4098 domain-containing protein YvlB